MNRIKILRMSQRKAERAVEVARLKARKLEEIDRLKALEMLQREALSDPKANKGAVIKKVKESSGSIATARRKQIPIESVFDNTIAAIKGRIEKQQQVERILQNKRTWLQRNEMQRNKIVSMEREIKEYLKNVKEHNMERLKKQRLNSYKELQQRIHNECRRLRQLGDVERGMLAKLNNTRLAERSHIRASVKVLDSIQAKQINKSCVEENRRVECLAAVKSARRNRCNRSSCANY
eukprot:TRINITY_DN12991_c0_g11_i3.p1 TRINITY_DN12991_c0_g11~~TRINITY_DN12991_c0_g11_i3.p1  ORF type:complete len:236 (+),score=75.94 TRINITY_DN12991_c0_g11_i3:343-1050(+)